MSDFINVRDYGATGDGTTDDRPAFVSAIADCIANSQDLLVPAGKYRLSKYVDILGANRLRIVGTGAATVLYPSDDLSLVPDAVANSYNKVRSGFLIRHSQTIEVIDVDFQGGTTPEVETANVGAGVYATHVIGLRITRCRGRDGGALFVQEAQPNSTYATGNSLAVSAGVVTLTNPGDPNALFYPGMIGRTITISNATNPVNNGIFAIVTVPSTTQLTYANAAAVAETTSSLVWSVDDADGDTEALECTWYRCRGSSNSGPGGRFIDCSFEHVGTPDLAGIPSAFDNTSGTVTLSDPVGLWGTAAAGRFVKVGGATSAGNNGTFQILSATPATAGSPAKLTYSNGIGVTELAPVTTATWWICGGERCARGNGASAISSSSGVVTLTANVSVFVASDVGTTVRLNDATTASNNGCKVITRYISATQIQYVDAAAVSESYAGVLTIDGYDSAKSDATVGQPLVGTSTSVAANTLTDSSLAMTTNAYAGRYLQDSAGRQWAISSNSGTAFTLLAGGSSPASGGYSVTGATTHGSTHALYFVAGRSNIEVRGCSFRAIRATGVKISGSNAPIHDIEVAENEFVDCGAAIIAGADDVQEHVGLSFHHNRLVDCGTNRSGWSSQVGIQLLGARDVKIEDNQFFATRDAIASRVNGGSVGGFIGIDAERYLPGVSQPLEGVIIARNSFSADPATTSPVRVADSAIRAERIGQLTYWSSTGTLTMSGSVMTLHDAQAMYSQRLVGASIELCFAPDSGNNSSHVLETKVGDFTITAVLDKTHLTYINASGVGSGHSAGTYRIKPTTLRGGSCAIVGNQFSGYGLTGITLVSCTAPQVLQNTFDRQTVCVSDDGSVAAHIANNVEIQAGSNNARILLTTGSAWPIVYGNAVTNGALAGGNLSFEPPATRSDMGVGMGSSTSVDHPLLGRRGRALASDAHAELVVAFGSELVDGDTFALNGTIVTYKSTSPGAGQFNSLGSLSTLLTGAGMVADDYGAAFSPSVATGHILIRGASATSTANAYYLDTINALNPTALVIPRNDIGGGEAIQYSRGEGDPGPVANKTVVWSMQTSLAGGVCLIPDNTDAAALASGGFRPLKSANNGGCCEVVQHNASLSSTRPSFRWTIS